MQNRAYSHVFKLYLLMGLHIFYADLLIFKNITFFYVLI